MEVVKKCDLAERHVFLDYLRVVACLMVIVIHCTEPYYIGEEGRCQVASAADAVWVTLFEMICRSCVPLFVMTSAYLLFPVRRPTGEFFRRRLLRVALPFVLWCVYYSVVYGSPVHRVLFNFPDAGGHLWFVPMLLGLYILMPLLSPWAEAVDERELRGWIWVWFGTTLLPFARKLSFVLFGEPAFGSVPYLWGEAAWNHFGTFYYISGFVGYLLLGLYFRRFGRQISWRETLWRALPLLAIGFAGMAFGFYLRFGGHFPYDAPYACVVDFELSLEYCSTFVAMAVVGWFMLFRMLNGTGWLYRRLILPLSQASYGTYLVHMTILLTLLPYFKPNLPTPFAIVSLAFVTFAGASLVSLAARHIPCLGTWGFGFQRMLVAGIVCLWSGVLMADYQEMRAELRAFYPKYGQFAGPVKDSRQIESVKKIRAELEAWCAAHPGYDALDVRRESYLAMRRHFVPFLFRESPFYFEAGVNGGWASDDCCPARVVNALCRRFYFEKGLFSPADYKLLGERGRERFLVCCGPFADDMHHLPPFHTIFTKGFGGVRAEVAAALAKCPDWDVLGRKELETALVGLDTIHDIQLKFAAEAKRFGRTCMADAAARCPWEPPKTFYEGLNALWFIREILGYVDGVRNFSLGRPDAWLIDFYRREIAAGTLTEAEARDLVARFLMIAECHLDTNAEVSDTHQNDETEIPLTLGGCQASDGSRTYNELTEMFLDAHLKLGLVYPKLHCRIAADDSPAYLRKIGEMLMAGHAVFALFNDDRHVPQFTAMGYPLDRARDYVCTGCWDGNVDSETDVDGANYVSVGRILELTLHRDVELEKKVGLKINPIDGATSFEQVRDTVYLNFIRFFRDVLSGYLRYGRGLAKVGPHPAYSMCLKGPLETRRDTTDGGVAFRPRVVTLAFLANVVDSLCAIRKVCFEDRAYSLDELLAAVRSNWRGEKGAAIRQAVLAAPYWGDDSAVSDGLMKWWIDNVSNELDGLKNDQGGPFVLATWIYREFKHWGEKTKATPDGRFDGDRLAQGFAPSEFRCKAGVTTVLNAIGSLDHSKLYASNANLAFEKSAMSPEVFEAVFRTACKKDMHLLQPNCLSVEELLDAQKHPERHQNLIIKVCGFSARFISLSKKWQDEVIARHRLR